MTMFTLQEKKNLKQLLACAVNKDEVLTLDGLHGYLFGLAIIPEPVLPSEWLTGIFGEEMLEVDNQEEAGRLMGGLFSAYNRIMQQHRDDDLVFPFDYDTIKQKDIRRIREWAEGFFLATSLRPETWGFDDAEELDGLDSTEEEDVDDEEADVAGSFAVIMGVAFPDKISEIFDRDDDHPLALDRSDPELEAKLFALLPAAVEILRDYAVAAGEGMANRRADSYPAPPQPRRVEKIGRNDPCPCASGLKYKKCCGK